MFFSNLKTNKFNTIQKTAIIVTTLAIAVILYKFITRIFIIIPVGEVGVFSVTDDDQSSDQPLLPGSHLISPLDEVVTISIRVQNLNQTIELISKEGIRFKLEFSLQYRLDPQKVSQLYQKIGNNDQTLIESRLSSLIRQGIVNYDLQSIYGTQREFIASQLNRSINTDLKSLGFIVESLNLQNVILPEKIAISIQDQYLAEQLANKRRIEAKGFADSQKILRGIFPARTFLNVTSDGSRLNINEPK
jgi:regulator of protease activity HflC (stomatin/prohibitin superfamily)